MKFIKLSASPVKVHSKPSSLHSQMYVASEHHRHMDVSFQSHGHLCTGLLQGFGPWLPWLGGPNTCDLSVCVFITHLNSFSGSNWIIAACFLQMRNMLHVFLLLALLGLGSGEEGARLLASKSLLNRYAVEGRDLTLQYNIYNVGSRSGLYWVWCCEGHKPLCQKCWFVSCEVFLLRLL